MRMRLPESGLLLEALLSGLGHAVTDGTDVEVDDVTEPQLAQALDAMARGDIEFVILESGDAFVQAAGEGDGPYALEFSPASGDGLQEVRGGVTAAAARAALEGYRRGDPAWNRPFPWSPL